MPFFIVETTIFFKSFFPGSLVLNKLVLTVLSLHCYLSYHFSKHFGEKSPVSFWQNSLISTKKKKKRRKIFSSNKKIADENNNKKFVIGCTQTKQ